MHEDPIIYDLDRVLKAFKRLNALNTPDEVARELHELGVRGVPSAACACPVAVYLHLFTEFTVFVGSRVANVQPRNERTFFTLGRFNDPVSFFIRQFDAGEYPKLCQVGIQSWT